MSVATETRQIVVQGARAVWRERIQEEDNLVKVIRIIESELVVGNKVSLIVIVGNPDAQVAITED